jgi:hypothetical protein
MNVGLNREELNKLSRWGETPEEIKEFLSKKIKRDIASLRSDELIAAMSDIVLEKCIELILVNNMRVTSQLQKAGITFRD